MHVEEMHRLVAGDRERVDDVRRHEYPRSRCRLELAVLEPEP